MKKYNEEMARKIKDWLTKDDWHFDFDESDGIFSFGISISGRLKNIQYLLKVNEKDYSVFGFSPITVDPQEHDTMLSMAEFICRVNYGLRNGGFEMDMNDGELRYHTFVNCDSIILSESVIRQSIYLVSHMFEHYGQGIVDVIYAGKSAEQAYNACEKKRERRADVAARLLEIMRSGAGSEKIESLLSCLTGEGDDNEPEGETDDMPMDVFEDQDDE